MTPEQEELIVCGLISAGFLSSLAGGTMNNKLGRRKTLIMAGTCFAVGGMTLMTAHHYVTLVVGEVLIGLAMGLESLTSPMYVSEVSKPSLRGMLVSSYALMVVCGQFCAGIVDGIFSSFDNGWRFMLGFTALPGTLMVCGYLQLPESPCWLVSAHQVERAKEVLDSIRSTDDEVLDEMQVIITSTRKNYRNEAKADSTLDQIINMLSNPATRRALFLGCGLMVLQQGIGINTVRDCCLCIALCSYILSTLGQFLTRLRTGHVLFGNDLPNVGL
jgi:MFS family permease